MQQAAANLVGERDRSEGALLGLAVGDALGMPTQYMPRDWIASRYGILDDFQPGP